MRIILVVALATGCGSVQHSEWGSTRSKLSGKTSLVFVNATPSKMCSLRIQRDGERSFGDNWLPPAGLPSGKTLAVKVEPGTYQATWATCRESGHVLAGTLTGETAFEVKDATQLFAYIADTVAPTKRAAPVDYHAMVKFSGQRCGDRPDPKQVVAARPAVAAVTPEPEPEHVDLGAFIDRKAKPHTKMKASLVRKIDMTDSRVGYVERRSNR